MLSAADDGAGGCECERKGEHVRVRKEGAGKLRWNGQAALEPLAAADGTRDTPARRRRGGRGAAYAPVLPETVFTFAFFFFAFAAVVFAFFAVGALASLPFFFAAFFFGVAFFFPTAGFFAAAFFFFDDDDDAFFFGFFTGDGAKSLSSPTSDGSKSDALGSKSDSPSLICCSSNEFNF